MTLQDMILQWLVVGVVFNGAISKTFDDNLNHVVVYDGKIYVGATNYIYVLNAIDLSEVQPKIRTCSDVNCDNVNKVMLISEKLQKLIACGSGQGTCEIRSLDNMKNVTSSSISYNDGVKYLAVSNDTRPAVFVFSEENEKLYTGITYGNGLWKSTNKKSYHHFLARYGIGKDGFYKDKDLDLTLNDVPLNDYLVYFKGGFEHNGFIYFVTNQKFKVEQGGVYMSKLIRVCQNDTDFYSYTDIILSCQKNDVNYNLIQDLTVFEPGKELRDGLTTSKKVMAATFVKGTKPDRLEDESAVCIFDIESIDANIMKAKDDFLKCPASSIREAAEVYLPNEVGGCDKTWNSSVSIACPEIIHYHYEQTLVEMSMF